MTNNAVLTTTSQNSIGLGTILFVVFLVLKLTGYINWSWLWITAPLWIPIVFALFLILFIFLFGIIRRK